MKILRRAETLELLKTHSIFVENHYLNMSYDTPLPTTDFAAFETCDHLAHLFEFGFLCSMDRMPILYAVPHPFSIEDKNTTYDSYYTDICVDDSTCCDDVFAETAKIAMGEIKLEDATELTRTCVQNRKLDIPIPKMSRYIFLGDGILAELDYDEMNQFSSMDDISSASICDMPKQRERIEKLMEIHDKAGIARPRVSLRRSKETGTMSLTFDDARDAKYLQDQVHASARYNPNEYYDSWVLVEHLYGYDMK